ncbi:MAG: DUF99 family protein [Candidatus Hadarchaeales archaeon]
MLGVDDGPSTSVAVLLVGVVCRGGTSVDGVLKTEIEKDGMDVTDKLIEMVSKSRHKGQLRVILTDGITFAGFNVLDVHRASDELGLPFIVISRKRPNMREMRTALKNLSGWKERWQLIKKTGKIYEMRPKARGPPLYIQPIGINLREAEKIVRMSCVRSSIPEPVRLAHMIATAMVKGESHGGP